MKIMFHSCKLSISTCLLCPLQHGMFECPRISPSCVSTKRTAGSQLCVKDFSRWPRVASTFPLGLIPRVFICGRQLKGSSRNTTCIKLSYKLYQIDLSYHPVLSSSISYLKTTIPLNMPYLIFIIPYIIDYNSTISFYGE